MDKYYICFYNGPASRGIAIADQALHDDFHQRTRQYYDVKRRDKLKSLAIDNVMDQGYDYETELGKQMVEEWINNNQNYEARIYFNDYIMLFDYDSLIRRYKFKEITKEAYESLKETVGLYLSGKFHFLHLGMRNIKSHIPLPD